VYFRANTIGFFSGTPYPPLKTTGPYQGVANPRNTGQIRNVTKTVRKKNRISHDQLYNVIQFGYHLQDFLKELTIFPDLCCIVAVDDILNDFNKALIVKSDEPHGEFMCLKTRNGFINIK
jgi:hypothetical protein